jgi:hypothetical protein
MSAPGNKPKPESQTILLVAGIYFTVTILLMRLLPPLAISLLLIGLIGVVGYVGYLFSKNLRARMRPGEDHDFASRVRGRYQDCRRKEEKFRSEAENIRQSIAALRDDIERSNTAGTDEVARAQRLIAEFEAEFNLRHAKAAFFADCAVKLKALLDRYQLQESISTRKRELDALRSANFDDEAALEETRYHLERDTIELDTITELSKEAFVSFKAEQAEELREKLEKLRSEL